MRETKADLEAKNLRLQRLNTDLFAENKKLVKQLKRAKEDEKFNHRSSDQNWSAAELAIGRIIVLQDRIKEDA